MSNTMNPILIRTANKKPNQKNWDFRHQGTTDFFIPQIIHCQRMTPGEVAKINCNLEMHSRPLAMPAGIRVHHNLRAFWVPAWAAHKDWFRFRTNVAFRQADESRVTKFQKWENDTYLYNVSLIKIFMAWGNYTNPDSYQFIIGNPSEEEQLDYGRRDATIAFIDKADQTTLLGYLRFNFTREGRILYNIFVQLGYEIKWAMAWDQTVRAFPEEGQPEPNNAQIIEATFAFNDDKKLSARALLSLIKIMIDWYVPTQYEEYWEQEWENQMENNYFLWNSSLVNLLTWVNYEQDRFNGAWMNPQGPNNEDSTFIIKDNTVIDDGTSEGAENRPSWAVVGGTRGQYGTTPKIEGSASSGALARYTTDLSDYILRALNAIQNYTTRNRIAGYRPIDRMLAHFGVHVDYKLIKRSTYITGTSQNFSQSATQNTADTAGDTADPNWMVDKGLIGGAGSSMASNANINFTWSAEDDGYLLIIDTILPRQGYYQGIKHHNMMTDWRELYIPEFDNLGTEAIPKSEVFNAFNSFLEDASELHNNDERIWGWEPTNAGMKTGYDTLSGDYRRKSINLGIEAMHTLRVFEDDGSNVPESVGPDFIKGNALEYGRLFQYAGVRADKFQFLAVTTDNGKGPWESISESLPITDGEGQMAKYNYGGSSYMN